MFQSLLGFLADDGADPWPQFSRRDYLDLAADTVLACEAPAAIAARAHLHRDAGRACAAVELTVGQVAFVLGTAAAVALSARLRQEAEGLWDVTAPADTPQDRRRFHARCELGRICTALARATCEAHALAAQARVGLIRDARP